MSLRSSKTSFTIACVLAASPGLAAAPNLPSTPAVAAPAPVTALREIGHVRAHTRFCQAVYDHAGLSTNTALINDSTISKTADDLTHADLDDNLMAKPRTIVDMQRSYEALMSRTRDAIDETKTLRKLADDAPTPEQKAALVAYADALGGALHRQQIAARDYREFGVYLEAHDPVAWQEHDREMMAANATQPVEFDPHDYVTPYLADLAKAEAVHLNDLHETVLDDEVRAGSSVDAAFGPCATATPDQKEDSPENAGEPSH
jgi:hypothetical protein